MEQRLQWFKDAKFGMFIHWGLYAIPARNEWQMMLERMSNDEYKKLANQFNPKKCNIIDWVKLAKKVGMKYVVLTTRHHDGFSLYDSKLSDYTSVKTAAHRDFIAEYVAACRQVGMKIGFYYSLFDWSRVSKNYLAKPPMMTWQDFLDGLNTGKDNPEAWAEHVDFVHGQVRELLTDYGKIDLIWFDGAFLPGPEPWQSQKLLDMIYKLQPEIVVNDRLNLPADYDTPEQVIKPSAEGRLWESCMTLNDHWGYNKYDDNWKTVEQLIVNLITCTGNGGNFLLNVGPDKDGVIPEPSVDRLTKVGNWLKTNNESIFGTDRVAGNGFKQDIFFGWSTSSLLTRKGNKFYLHVRYWCGKELCTTWPGDKKIKSAYLLKTGKKVKIVQERTRVFLKGLPEQPVRTVPTVIVLITE
jgi:alpha-L-fucosidase